MTDEHLVKNSSIILNIKQQDTPTVVYKIGTNWLLIVATERGILRPLNYFPITKKVLGHMVP